MNEKEKHGNNTNSIYIYNSNIMVSKVIEAITKNYGL